MDNIKVKFCRRIKRLPLVTKGKTTNNGQKIKETDIEWPWSIHKEADTLLHSRVNSFLAIQAVLIGGYFASRDNGISIIHAVIILSGISWSVWFFFYTKRIIIGINTLKSKYLISDPVYSEFYGDRIVSYNMAPSLAGGMILLWFSFAIHIFFLSNSKDEIKNNKIIISDCNSASYEEIELENGRVFQCTPRRYYNK